jgi:glycosyltransferase involved in cell wall biosynthesis
LKLTITIEYRFDSTPDGKVWTETVGDYSFWQRYLKVFDSVEVLARVRSVAAVSASYKRADGDRVKFLPVPYYIGPYDYLLKRQSVLAACSKAFEKREAVIFRVPGQLPNLLQPALHKSTHPYAVEVVGDPYEVFAPGAYKGMLRWLFRWWMTRCMKLQCREALAAAYVTKEALQRRYPCDGISEGISDVELPTDLETTFRYTTNYSSIDLTSDACTNTPRSAFGQDGSYTLIMVGSIAQLYKAPDVLIDAISICLNMGLKLRLNIVGDGKHRKQLENQVSRLGLQEIVRFIGQLPAGEQVRQMMDAADLFVLASRTEGLPRAMIEAMARGLPCIGSTAGGIPELLPSEDMVCPGDADALARKIQEVLANPVRMKQMSERNIGVAKEYDSELLANRRKVFYSYVKEITLKWQDKFVQEK